MTDLVPQRRLSNAEQAAENAMAAVQSSQAAERRSEAAINIQKHTRGHNAVRRVSLTIGEIHSEFAAEGWGNCFMKFNSELLRPFTREDTDASAKSMSESCGTACQQCLPAMVATICSTLPNPCRPTSDKSRKMQFVVWNVLCFWLGVLDLVVMFALRGDHALGVWGWSIALIDGVLGYLFAYTFYFIFISYGNKAWMGRCLWIIFFYAAGTAYLTYEGLEGPGTHIVKTEGAINGLKAVANLIVFFHGLQMWTGGGARLTGGRPSMMAPGGKPLVDMPRGMV